jgi:hypothetical protein
MDPSAQKIAILKRLREMLVRQRERFADYLTLLEKEEESIRDGDSDRLLAHVEMERGIIADIFTLKKVIAPLETLYQAAYPETESTIPRMKATLEAMNAEVIAHNARNRDLLRDRAEVLRKEIASLRPWPRDAAPYAEVVPRMVDITT